jgi:hypothetical protein
MDEDEVQAVKSMVVASIEGLALEQRQNLYYNPSPGVSLSPLDMFAGKVLHVAHHRAPKLPTPEPSSPQSHTPTHHPSKPSTPTLFHKLGHFKLKVPHPSFLPSVKNSPTVQAERALQPGPRSTRIAPCLIAAGDQATPQRPRSRSFETTANHILGTAGCGV